MSVLCWILLGGLVGWVASVRMGSPSDLLIDIGIGMAGALIGGYSTSWAGVTRLSGIAPWSLSVAVIGAAALIFVARAIRQRA